MRSELVGYNMNALQNAAKRIGGCRDPAVSITQCDIPRTLMLAMAHLVSEHRDAVTLTFNILTLRWDCQLPYVLVTFTSTLNFVKAFVLVRYRLS